MNPKAMIKFLTTLLVCVVFVLSSRAQETKVDVLYLKNGSIIKGSVQEMDAQTIKIETKDGSLFVFKMEEVDRLKKETVAAPIVTQTPAPTAGTGFVPAKQKGYQSIIELGAPIGIGTLNKTYGFCLSYSAMYKFKNAIMLGAGTGGHIFLSMKNSAYIGVIIPLFIDFRVRFTRKRYSPFFFLKPGGNMIQFDAASASKTQNLGFITPKFATFGLYGNTGLGFDGYFSPKAAWSFCVSYQINSYFLQSNYSNNKGQIFNFVNAGIGFRF